MNQLPAGSPWALALAWALCCAVTRIATATETGPEAAADLMTQEGMGRVFQSIYTTGLDLDHPLQVENLRLPKDALDLTLTRGTIYLAQPVAGKVTGALFVGEGRARLTPAGTMDRKALKREIGKESLDDAFTEAMFHFDDDTDVLLRQAGRPGGVPAQDAGDLWATRNKILQSMSDLALDFIENRINGLPGRSYFAVEFNTTTQKWLLFNLEYRSRLEAALLREKTMGAGKRFYEPLVIFHKKDEYDARGNYSLLPVADRKDTAALRHLEMVIEIPNTKTVLIDSQADVQALADGVRILRFNLVNNIGGASWTDEGQAVKVTLVADDRGQPLPYLHAWHELLVLLPRPLARGEMTRVRIKATEDTIIQLTPSSYWIYSAYSWHPQMGDPDGRYTFDWTIKVAKPMRAAGTGDLVREWEEGKLNCGQWRSDIPVRYASFIFGEYTVTEGAYKREPPATGEVALRLFAIRGGSVAVKGKKENILYNVEQGMKHFEKIFGPYPFKDLDVAQMERTLGFAHSPPGILMLNWVMEGGGGGGVSDQVIFHELAHQWWGHQVARVGVEDDWISESWAEYAAGLLTEGIDPKKFQDKLKEWKQGAVEADTKGTISTAYYSDMRNRLLYDKGPYVLHMLRTWMGWEKFTKLTTTVQAKYTWREINADTIAREASTIMGYDMFPFFDQWVRDRGIPKVRYSWSAAPEQDGKFLVTIRAYQDDVDNFKFLMVPVSFDFGKGDPVVVLKPILKPQAEIQVRVPAKPVDVRMDAQGTQLADFIKEKG